MSADKGFPELKNYRILRAALGEPVDKVPVWVMRQAGRYLPEFMEMRKTHSFFDMCQKPEVACEVTMQPIRRFDLDAAIIFSDILVIPQAMGMNLEMRPGEGPVFTEPIKSPSDLERLHDIDPKKDLKYVMDAISTTRHALQGKVPLFGFSGAPWTLMCYMIEGKGSKTQSNAKKWLYKHPEEAAKLFTRLEDIIIEYMTAQVEAGAQILQLFDTNVGYLDEKMFLRHVRPGYVRIAQGVRDRLKALQLPAVVPLALFPKDAHLNLRHVRDVGFDVVSVDWSISPQQARELLGDNVTIQGNLDPCALYADEATLRELVTDMVTSFGKSRYIANLGHGMYPDMDPERVRVFVEAVHSCP